MEQHVNRDPVQVFQFSLDRYWPDNFGEWTIAGPDPEATAFVDRPNFSRNQLLDKGVLSRKACNQQRVQKLSLGN
jgi:hypothetical protein